MNNIKSQVVEIIARAVAILASSIRIEVDEFLLESYRIALQDVAPEKIERAIEIVLQGDFQFMPTPGRLRFIARSGVASLEYRADIAWHEFDQAVGRYGGDCSVSFDDGLINATVRSLGGWPYCCEKTGDDYNVWLKKEFKETYCRLWSCDDVSSDLRAPLTGRLALANSGYAEDELGKYKAFTGGIESIPTEQPVLLPPSDAIQSIGHPRGGEPKQLLFDRLWNS
ncbi:DUF6475 domain-containing protein [Bythopirellula polymerisocia]|uniref:DUF6475 domain-containing protein n=1 Tax=Bythopirellula polymerisocia TaxID=2528003 RepID=A0A5C6CWM2_9BACT|nr:DUF6475 domain-containing protein [Bythopirellula polymerisocia]TWU27396.1 hypothetical protein Pla144_21690 [Bythopirellula polymerisocia]